MTTDSSLPFETQAGERAQAPGLLRARRAPRAGSLRQRWGRELVHGALRGLERGELLLHDARGARRFGPGGEGESGARVEVRDPAFYTSVLRGGSLGAAEAWIRGEWHSDDLTAVFRLAIRNASMMHGFDRGVSRLTGPLVRAGHFLARNTRRGSRRNIAAHYDLGNDLFDAFLDPTLSYSAAVFERPEVPLEQAQRAKYERLCRKLSLGPDDHVLEIGTGWGGFALHAAGRHGCRVTTTTISEEQYAVARARVEAAGLADRITLLRQDYRELQGRFDALVSIEMIEAVGAEFLDQYLRVCADRLEPHGRAAIQAILAPDRHYEQFVRTVDFIKQYVFPGGCLPSLAAITTSMARTGDLRLVDVEDITPHYAETLRRWRDRFQAQSRRVAELGYDERFRRLWNYYLSYCEAGFEERYIRCQQIVFAKPEARGAGERLALPR